MFLGNLQRWGVHVYLNFNVHLPLARRQTAHFLWQLTVLECSHADELHAHSPLAQPQEAHFRPQLKALERSRSHNMILRAHSSQAWPQEAHFLPHLHSWAVYVHMSFRARILLARLQRAISSPNHNVRAFPFASGI